MNRRGFLSTLIGGVTATAAVRTFPFRVFSFPIAPRLLTIAEIRTRYLEPAVKNLLDEQYRRGVLGQSVGFDWYAEFDATVGSIITITSRPVLLVDREVVTVKSWNPRTEELIVSRGS
jgi:hypothetical protein